MIFGIHAFRKSLMLIALFSGTATMSVSAADLTPMEQLGKKIYFDDNLSDPVGQSCSSCHLPEAGWVGPDSDVNAAGASYPGAIHKRMGNRKPPSAAYASFSPNFYFDSEEEHFVGGNFWDGRATGWLLGSPTADQAQGPFLNPVEQNVASAKVVVSKVCESVYGNTFRAHFGTAICDNTLNAYNAIAQAISAYESSSEVNPFSSKYDYYLKDAKQYPLTDQELLGLQLFNRPDKGNCAACHPSTPAEEGGSVQFTDFTYDNLGIPRNPQNGWYRMPESINPQGDAWIDRGLGGFLETLPMYASRAEESLGKHRVPTLRNLNLRPNAEFIKAYGHNGYFKSIEEIVHFYNTRDSLGNCESIAHAQPKVNCWPAPEITQNLNRDEMGDLGLTLDEEQAIVDFLKTLDDGWTPPGS